MNTGHLCLCGGMRVRHMYTSMLSVCVCTCFPGRKHLLQGVRGHLSGSVLQPLTEPACWTDPLCGRAKTAAGRSAWNSCLIRPSHGPPSDTERVHPVWPNESLVCWIWKETQEIFIACWIEQIARVFYACWKALAKVPIISEKSQLSWRRSLLGNYAKHFWLIKTFSSISAKL